MPHAYTEDQFVEQPAKAAGAPLPWPSANGRDSGVFAEFGWTIAFGNPHPNPFPAGEGVGVDGLGLLGRETECEVGLLSRLRAGLERLNQAVPPEAIAAAVEPFPRAGHCRLP